MAFRYTLKNGEVIWVEYVVGPEGTRIYYYNGLQVTLEQVKALIKQDVNA